MTSEGIRAEVIRVDPDLVAEVLGEEPSPTADPTDPAGDETGTKDGDSGSDPDSGGSLGPAALVVLAVAAYFLFRKRT